MIGGGGQQKLKRHVPFTDGAWYSTVHEPIGFQYGLSLRPDQINLLLLGFAGRNFGTGGKILYLGLKVILGLVPSHGDELSCACTVPRARISALSRLKMVCSLGPGVHLSIRVQSGPRCLLTKIFFSPLDITFADLCA